MRTMIAVSTGRRPARREATLRPHTLMLDLLLATVMLFAFHLGPATRPAAVDTRDLSAPGQTEATTSMLLHPVRGPDGQAYREAGQSKLLSPPEVAALARARGARLALVADPRASLGAFLEAEGPLREMGLDVALAVAARTERRRTP